MEFKESQTKENLMRAFAGESQARNRYTIAANQARKENMEAVARMFLYTADQEREHAEIFYGYLKEMAGENIQISGGYPVDISEDLVDILTFANHNEKEEAQDVYPSFADVAQKEGYTQIAAAFHMIARIEETHGDRFLRFANWMKAQQLYTASSSTKWICLNCGYIYEGESAPVICPVCKHPQGYYSRLALSPFADDRN
jgi:rubrerythrin